MKRMLALLLSGMMVLSMAGCGSDQSASGTADTQTGGLLPERNKRQQGKMQRNTNPLLSSSGIAGPVQMVRS